MTYQRSLPWLYVAGGAALGFLGLGPARARLRRARQAGGSAKSKERPGLAGDVSEMPIPVREALAASGRVHGLTHPISEELAHDIFGHAVERRPTPGNQRHEVDSALRRDDPRRGTQEELASVLDQPPEDEGELTARPRQEAVLLEDAYDAVAPDDLGSEWLMRATETSTMKLEGDEPFPMDAALNLRDAGMSVVSQSSLDAASAEPLEFEPEDDDLTEDAARQKAR